MAETFDLAKIRCKIGFIGGGNMAKALFDGFLNKKLLTPGQIYVSGPHLQNLHYFKEKGATTTEDNAYIVETCDFVFISVKPQMLHTMTMGIKEITRKRGAQVVFVSILAGTSIKIIETALDHPLLNVVRVMPNTAVAIGEGCCVFACNEGAAAVGAADTIKLLLESAGLCFEVPESQIDAIGALSGSGPAFMYLILEALADGGVKMGIPRCHAIALAAQTMLGAAKMVQLTGKHSAELKDEVCSAGGTTITGMHALERGGVRAAIMDAIEAATNKSIAMSQSTAPQRRNSCRDSCPKKK